MTLDAAEFIRRFLLHVLPSGFHRIRHYGLFAGVVRAHNIEGARHLLAAPEASHERSRAEADSEAETASPARQCQCCGGRMIVVETFEGAPCAFFSADPDQDRRVLIERKEDGLFRFVEQARHDVPLDVPCEGDRERWASLRPYATICDTAASAEREARATIDWLHSSGLNFPADVQN